MKVGMSITYKGMELLVVRAYKNVNKPNFTDI